MADQIEQLKHLQLLDGQLFQLRRQQREKPHELEQVEAEVASHETRAKAAEDQLSALQRAQKEKDLELQTREATIKKLQGQLFQVKTNKEYTAMQHEIDTLKADVSLLEETLLQGFDAVEQATTERQRQRQQLAQQQQRLAAERQRIEAELAQLDEQVARLERDRQALTPSVHVPTLVVYERILAIREGLALVPLLNDSCGGCHRRLPPQVVNQVYLKADLVMCESCSRILYFDEAHSKL